VVSKDGEKSLFFFHPSSMSAVSFSTSCI
jgi:hypothetical protein